MDSSIPKDVTERITWYTQKLPDLLDNFENDNPNWQQVTILSLLQWGLKSLQHYLDCSEENEINWDNPFLELHFPVDVEIEENDLGQETYRLISGHLTDLDVETSESATKALSKILIRHLEIISLEDLVDGAAFAEKDSKYWPVLGLECINHLNSLDSEDERNEFLKGYLRPRSFGGGTIDGLELGAETEQDVPICVREQLAQIDESLVVLSADKDGHKIRIATVFEIQPLIISHETNQGYFPIVVGLIVQPGESDASQGWIEEPWAKLAEWSNDDRNAIWEGLDQQIELLLEALDFNPSPEIEEVLVEIKATIRMKVPQAEKKIHVNELIQALQQSGDIQAIEVIDRTESLPGGHHEVANNLVMEKLLNQIETAEEPNLKGRALEELITKLFVGIDGFQVESNVNTETEEIDVWIQNHCKHPPFDRESLVIIAECKNWSSRIGKNEFIAFQQKIANRTGRCKLGFLISWNGFADTIYKEALRGSKDDIMIVLLSSREIRSAIQTGDFLKILSDCWNLALKS